MASTNFNQTPVLSTSTSPPTLWDVFLSFRGVDTRYTFTDHLFDALNRSGVRTFRDDPELGSGEVISETLVKAIQESKTYVVVFSKNYASSGWCLDELVEIVRCSKSFGRLVLPIYYNIEPSVVRQQTGRFNKAFEENETHFEMHRLHKWRAALTSMGNLSGYRVCKNKSQAEIINKVIDRVLLEINPRTLDVAKYPIGLDSRVEGITEFLSSNTDGVVRIGIHGIGGIGKTTLAKAVYNQNYHRFKGSCFLANVREVSGTEKGLISLQQQLISDVLKCKSINIDNVDKGIALIRARICLTKVLIVIDDLDNPGPLEFIEGPFAAGSIVIITTRNEDLLDAINVKIRYKVSELGYAESRQLFSKYAFGDNKITESFMKLSEEVLERAGGLPLALKVFGSNLLNQSEEGWRWFIDKMKRVPIEDVEKKLLISFDALKLVDPMLQDIFLDVACFFIGSKKEEAVKIMETCYTFVNHYIDFLMKRCLLMIDNRDELGMHDLIRDMGREIAHSNSHDNPGKHSRLWESKDIYNVLKQQKGTEAILGIIPTNFKYQNSIGRLPFVDIVRNMCYQHALERGSFFTETFKRMSRLRFLYLRGVNLTGSFELTFEDLRWLCWEDCPFKCLPSEFYPQKLVILELPRSNLITMWELNMVPQVFEKLKTLNMSYSLLLTSTPDFNKLPCIETLCLEGCKSLYVVHQSIGSLARLVSLNLRGCVKLRSLPETICNLRALEVLSIDGCNSLKSLPTKLGKIESLTELNAEGLSVSKLPDSVGSLSKLIEMILSSNRYLETLPETICNLTSLRSLNIGDCSGLEVLPTNLGNMKSLTMLNAEGLTVWKLPDSIGHLSKLVTLKLCGNTSLESLPDSICNLRALKCLNICGCSSLEALPLELGNMESLAQLIVKGLAIRKLPDSIGHLGKLVELNLGYNEKLETLPDTICNLEVLELLDIDGCSSLEVLPIGLGNIQSLKQLNAWGLTISKLPDSIGRLSNLIRLKLSNNENIETLPITICNLKQLEILDLRYCSGLSEIQVLKDLISIKTLHLGGCNSSTLVHTLTKHFFQIYSGLGHQIKIYTQASVFQDWISQSPYWISRSSYTESTVSLELLPNVSHNFLAMILCFELCGKNKSSHGIYYSVKTTTSDFTEIETLDAPYYHGSLIIIVPRSIFAVRDGDHRIELTAEASVIGITLLYKPEITTIDENTTVNR